MKHASSESPRRHLIVAISGASGASYGVRLLQRLKASDTEAPLIISRNATVTLAIKTSYKSSDSEALADVVYANDDLEAACSSGSFQNLGMLVAACSIKTMAEIATAVTADLISRAAHISTKRAPQGRLDTG